MIIYNKYDDSLCICWLSRGPLAPTNLVRIYLVRSYLGCIFTTNFSEAETFVKMKFVDIGYSSGTLSPDKKSAVHIDAN